MKILFKALRLDGEGWAYGVPVESVNDKVYIINGATEDAINTRNEVDFFYTDVDPATVCQYTGLEDKNGVEIFGADRWLCDIDDGLPTEGHIKWIGDGWAIVHDDDGKDEYSLPLFEIYCDLQITGNIFEGEKCPTYRKQN